MTRSQSRLRQQNARTNTQQIVEHPDEPDQLLPEDYLERHHPENDRYMKAVEHVQRQLMHQTTLLRTKQVNILKSVFAGDNYAEAARKHNTAPQTVSKLTKSPHGARLLNLLQYHLNMIEGPNLAQRRALLWRIARDTEEHAPNTAIKAVDSLNKMTYQEFEQNNPTHNSPNTPNNQPIVQITINELLPRGNLD